MNAKKFLIRLLIFIVVTIFIANKVKYAKINSWITDVDDLVKDSNSYHYINDLYISDGRHYEHLLDAKEKKLYEDLYNAIKERQSTVILDLNEFEYNNFTRAVTVDTAFENVFEALSMDHPELIYYSPPANMFRYQTNSKSIEVYLEYSMDETTYQENIIKIQNILLFFKEETKGMSEYEKCKYVYEWLGTNNYYGAKNGSLTHSAYSAFMPGEGTVCEGYAKAAQIIFQNIGVNSIYTVGTLNGGKHAWNLVKIENKYYYFDATNSSTFKENSYGPMSYIGFLPKDVENYKFRYKQITPKVNGKKYLYYQYNNLEIKFSNDNKTYEKIKEIANSKPNNSVIEFRIKNIGNFKKHIHEVEEKLEATYYKVSGLKNVVFFVK